MLLRGIPGNALRVFPGSFWKFSGISSGKSQPYWGYGPSFESNSWQSGHLAAQVVGQIGIMTGPTRGALAMHHCGMS